MPDSSYEFRFGECLIKVHITFPPPYEGKRLEVYRGTDQRKAVCVALKADSRGCTEQFVGAIAVVDFAVTRLVDGKPAKGSIREIATLVDQSPGLPPRPPYEMNVKLINGLGSDLQAFGYDEAPLPAADQPAERESAKQAWRRFRQELFLNNDQRPFAIVEWMHTTTSIRVVQLEEPVRSITSRRSPPAP